MQMCRHCETGWAALVRGTPVKLSARIADLQLKPGDAVTFQSDPSAAPFEVHVKVLTGMLKYCHSCMWRPDSLRCKLHVGKTTMLKVRSTTLVESLKCKLQTLGHVPPDHQRLIHSGKQLEDGRTVGEYGIKSGSVLHLVLRCMLSWYLGTWQTAIALAPAERQALCACQHCVHV